MKKNKKILREIKLQIEAGKANPSPPIGPALGQSGVNIMEFCKAFNEKTKASSGFNIPVVIYVYEDRSFTFIIKKPPASDLIKKVAGIDKGSDNPLKNKVAKITRAQVLEIVKQKLDDLNTSDEEQASKIIEGSARSMGVEITNWSFYNFYKEVS